MLPHVLFGFCFVVNVFVTFSDLKKPVFVKSHFGTILLLYSVQYLKVLWVLFMLLTIFTLKSSIFLNCSMFSSQVHALSLFFFSFCFLLVLVYKNSVLFVPIDSFKTC